MFTPMEHMHAFALPTQTITNAEKSACSRNKANRIKRTNRLHAMGMSQKSVTTLFTMPDDMMNQGILKIDERRKLLTLLLNALDFSLSGQLRFDVAMRSDTCGLFGKK